MKKWLLLLSFVFATTSVFAAETNDAFSGKQREAIENIVHDYLMKNPDVLIDASKVLQQRQEEKVAKQAQSAIQDSRAELLSNNSPVVGNPKADVAIVEFFDYQCIHCKHMAPLVSQLLSSDQNIKVVYKQLPIFGGASEFAAKAALASAKQGKYKAFHETMINSSDKLTNDKIMAFAKKSGIDTTRLSKDMKSPEVSKELKANFALAEKIGVMGTPAFIVLKVNDQNKNPKTFFIPGATTDDMLKSLIRQLR